MNREQKARVRKAARLYANEIRSFGKDLWKYSGHRIMVRLLEAYKDEPNGIGPTKAAIVYGLKTGCGLGNAKALAREMGARL